MRISADCLHERRSRRRRTPVARKLAGSYGCHFAPHDSFVSGTLIAGRYSEVGEEVGRAESFELYRNALHDVEVITFDELFASAEGLITILEHGRASELLSIAAEAEASRGAR